MTTRYLCKNHFQKFCQDLDSANNAWNSSMNQGMQALDSNKHQQAQRCFGTAYEIAQIILDRKITSQCNSEFAANTLLSAQYLATSLVYLNKTEQAVATLNHIHEKFIFLCRNSAAAETLRSELCSNMIPYLEKLYEQVLNKKSCHEVTSLQNYSQPVSWHIVSTLYH